MSRGPRLLALLLSLGIVLVVFGEALPHLADHFLGLEYVDHYGTQWFYWYTEHQLRAGEGFGKTDLFFYPWGKDLFAHTGSNVIDGILALPFRMLLGPVLGYNVFVLTGMFLTGAAFWNLAREYSSDRLACLLGATLFTLSPFLLHDLTEGRPTQAILLVPVLFVQQLLRTGRRRGLGPSLLAGLFLALSGYQYWFYALFGGIVALAHGLWLLARPGTGAGGRWRILARHGLMAAIALALVAPVAIPLAHATAEGGEVPGLLRTDLWSLTASPPVTAEGQTIGLFVWQPFPRWSGFHVLDMELTEHLLEQALLLPWLWVPVSLAFLLGRSRIRRGPLVAIALASMILAAGSIVQVGGWALPNPPFIALSKLVGVMRRLWWPARALSFFTIVLGLAVVDLLDRAGRRGLRLQAGLAILLSVAWLGELRAGGHLPFPTWQADIPAGYRCLADGPPGALIELPHAWTQAHLYYQSAHGRPIMGGMLENNPVFTPPALTRLRRSNRFLRELAAATRPGAPDVRYTAADARTIHDLGYRYVVFQKDAFIAEQTGASRADNVQRTRLRRTLKGLRRMLGPPVYDDVRLAIFAPWGDPRPCAPGAVLEDRAPASHQEMPASALVHGDLEAQVIQRVWASSLAGVVEAVTDPTQLDKDTGEEEGAVVDTGTEGQEGTGTAPDAGGDTPVAGGAESGP